MIAIKKIKKRNGRIVRFDSAKIFNAIQKAFIALQKKDGKIIQNITNKISVSLNKKFAGKIPSIEDIQNQVEETLIDSGYLHVARTYMLYRKKRAELREIKSFIGVEDDLKLPLNALVVLKKRYLLKNDKGEIVETPSEMFKRVAKAVAKIDRSKQLEEKFYKMMSSLDFLPNSPTLMNAGTDIGQLSACFVIPVDDSLEKIFEPIKEMAIIQQSGGGTGFSFSKLRPKGDVVRSTHGVASGPVSFINIFDETTDVIKQGGRRRGANMGILSIYHPDIVEFITYKEKEGRLKNFNISVAVDSKFMGAVRKNEKYSLTNPRNGKKVISVKAKGIFDLIVASAWKTGDPGIIFLDEINRMNPLLEIGKIEATNPCGEQPLMPYESCNLGSINLVNMLKKGKIDWEKLKETIELAVHFLDNVIDVNRYPLSKIQEITKKNRKIGLGVMGFAEMLILLGIPYNSKKALRIAEKLMRFIRDVGHAKSQKLGKEKGSFPNFKWSSWKKKGYRYMRNSTVTTIAPTGSISIIAGCTSGIEPLFAVSFVREVLEGTKLLEINPTFEKRLVDLDLYSRDLIQKVAQEGNVQGIKEIPKSLKYLFVTSLDIDPLFHVKMQAAFQKYTDNAVSKTVNLPENASQEDVRRVFMLAHKLKCKGTTVFRYGSKISQVLYKGMFVDKETAVKAEHVTAQDEYSGGCPGLECVF